MLHSVTVSELKKTSFSRNSRKFQDISTTISTATATAAATTTTAAATTTTAATTTATAMPTATATAAATTTTTAATTLQTQTQLFLLFLRIFNFCQKTSFFSFFQ